MFDIVVAYNYMRNFSNFVLKLTRGQVNFFIIFSERNKILDNIFAASGLLFAYLCGGSLLILSIIFVISIIDYEGVPGEHCVVFNFLGFFAICALMVFILKKIIIHFYDIEIPVRENYLDNSEFLGHIKIHFDFREGNLSMGLKGNIIPGKERSLF